MRLGHLASADGGLGAAEITTPLRKQPEKCKVGAIAADTLNSGTNKCYIHFMTKRFEQAVAEIRKLPDERQDQVAELLIELANEEGSPPRLTPEQIEGVRLALRQAELRQFASDESVERLLYRPWK
ncbi:MAG: hypothetical protein WCF79_14480 [Rhodomicrobium sp.]